MGAGDWRLATGDWRLAAGDWRLATGDGGKCVILGYAEKLLPIW